MQQLFGSCSSLFSRKVANIDETEKIQTIDKEPVIILNWTSVCNSLSSTHREELIRRLEENLSKPNLQELLRLGQILLHEAFVDKHTMHHVGSLYSGLVIIEWLIRRVDICEVIFDKVEYTRLLANAHCEVYKGNAIVADPYNLGRAIFLYSEYLKIHGGDATVMLAYSQVLQYSGQLFEAREVIMNMLNSFEDHENFPFFLMLAGSLLKSMSEFDKAGSYFFESMNSGPPRLFNKLDMMFIVARTLEEQASQSGNVIDDGYKMVHHHLVSDGVLSHDITYEDWINDASTWRVIADKCAICGIYSLAADLYGQGLNRDMVAFRKTKLWLGFAKACSRSGKNSEAQLALRQALSLNSSDEQCKIALDHLTDMSVHKFEFLVQCDSLQKIVEIIPDNPQNNHICASKIQALARGVKTRSPTSSPIRGSDLVGSEHGLGTAEHKDDVFGGQNGENGTDK